MNNIIAASRLAEMLSARTGMTADEATQFINRFFQRAYDVLASGDNLTISRLGTFRLTGNPGQPLVFEPEASFTEVVNAPFEAFAPVVLNEGEDAGDDVADPAPAAPPVPPVASLPPVAPVPPAPPVLEAEADEIHEDIHEEFVEEVIDVLPPPPPVVEAAPEPIAEVPEAEGTSEAAPSGEPRPEGADDAAGEEPSAPEPPAAPLPPAPPAPPVAPAPESEDNEPHHHATSHRHEHYYSDRHSNRGMTAFWLILTLVFGIIVGFAAGYYFHGNLNINITQSTLPGDAPEVVYEDEETEEAEATDEDGNVSAAPEATTETTTEKTAEPAAPAAAQQPAKASAANSGTYDTVTSTTFLTTLARRHYGQMEYWVYIYDANPQLGDPNRIAPGTRVFVPDKSSLPLTGNRDADIARAKARSAEIYSKYSRK